MARFRCTVCNWVYDEEVEGVPFADVTDDWSCPQCGAPKSAFVPEGLSHAAEGVETTVADRVVDQLVALGVSFIYGIPGDSNLPLADALRRDGRIRFVLTRHEETAAFMASAHGKMTDTLGVCTSIAGPGATNLVTGLMDASADRSPVLALVGQIPEVYLGSEAFQEIDQLELFHPFTAFSETIARSDQAVGLTMSAAKHAYRNPGVSVLSTPTDILVEKSDADRLDPASRLHVGEAWPADDEIDAAVKLIDSCDRVAILTGWGARHHGDLVSRLSERLKAPVATTSRGKGTVHETDRRSVGVLGSIGGKRAGLAFRSAELVLVVGTGFRHASLIPEGVKIIQVDRDSTRIGRTFDVTAGVLGDAGRALSMLAASVAEKQEDAAWWKSIDSGRAEFLGRLEGEGKDDSKPVNPGRVVQAIQGNVAGDAIITVDVGDHTYWFFRDFICSGQRVFLSANIASMGFGLPAALAGQLAYPDRQVVCLTGDGGFGMLMADFTTAVREKLPINVIVMNDGKLKNIKKEQARDGYPEFGVAFPNPSFATFAETCGGVGFRVEEPGELESAIAAAFASDLPAIVEVMVDPERMAASAKTID